MASDYPKRESHFAHKLVRLMIRTCAAQEIGPGAALLVAVIVHTEDSKRYTAPVTFWNHQLQDVLGMSWGQLDRARKKAVAAGWLHYERKATRSVSKYWTLVPPQFAGVPDGACDCDADKVFHQNGERNAETEDGSFTDTEKQTWNKRGRNVEQTWKKREPSSLTLLPDPGPNPQEHVPSARSASTDQFELFWKMVLATAPHKAKSKGEAAKRYVEAVRKLKARPDVADPHAFLLDRGAAYYASPEGQTPYANGPAPWINKGRYDDDPKSWTRKDAPARSCVPGPGQRHPDDADADF